MIPPMVSNTKMTKITSTARDKTKLVKAFDFVSFSSRSTYNEKNMIPVISKTFNKKKIIILTSQF